MTRKEVSDRVWTIVGLDENWVFGGSMGEAFDAAINITYAVINHDIKTKEEFEAIEEP